MSLEDNIRVLERAPVLAEIGRDALRLLAFSVEMKQFAAQEVLFAEGDMAECAYVVAAGRVALGGPDDKVRIVGPGTLIGEMALIVPTARPCDALAVDTVQALVVPRALFRRMLDEFPNIARMLQERLAARMRGEAEDLARISESLSRLPGS